MSSVPGGAGDFRRRIGDAGVVSSAEVSFDARRIARLRRYTWWSVVPTIPVYSIFPLFDLATAGRHYSTAAVVVLGVLLAVIVVEGTRFCTALMRGLGQARHHPLEQAAVFALSLVALGIAIGHHAGGVLWAVLPGGLAGAYVSTAPDEQRWPVSIATTLVTALTAGLLVQPEHPGMRVVVGCYAGGFVAFTVFLLVVGAWFWDVVLELDRARTVSAELAIARERLRFAADLHDVQGHNLQAIALKAELAERLAEVDAAAAKAQAGEVAELARAALKDTRNLVQGYRRSKLTDELANAREIFESAGIYTTVDGDASRVPPPLQSLFGSLLREGTTNILRHSRADRVEVRVNTAGPQVSVTLRNNGSAGASAGGGSGLAGLRERFEAMGGPVRAERTGEWFELHGHVEVAEGAV